MTERPKNGPGSPDERGADPGAEAVDARLARLAIATADVRADDALAGWILDRVGAAEDGAAGWTPPAGGLERSVWRMGRVAFAGFLAAAMACVVWSVEAQASVDDGVLASFDPVEIEP